ncbi:MAG: class I SAM-dependent methyltransferase [Candidatus Hydrogenedentota bacterium]
MSRQKGGAIIALLVTMAFACNYGAAQAPGSSSAPPAFEDRHTDNKRENNPGARGEAPGDTFFQSMPQAKDAAEKQILDVLAKMAASGRRMQSVPMDDGRFLRVLAESTNAQHIVEIGTSQGFSALWFCLALRKTGGKLTTFEINSERADLANANFERAGVSDIATVVLGNAHEEVTKLEAPIDILFLDADKRGYLDYLNKLLPQIRPGGLIVAHNITPALADPAFVAAITENPELESLLVNLEAGGISITLKKR